MAAKEPVKKDYKIGIGVDPEFFVIDTELMRLASAHDLVPGTKEAPHPLKYGAVQVDGLAIEYNTEPAYSAEDFVKFNTEVMKQIREMVPKRYEFLYKPTVFFDVYYFDKAGIPDKSKELGCSPDYDAYTGKMNPRPDLPEEKKTMRTGSGHIHISWTKDADVDDPSHRFDCNHVVKALDLIVLPYLKSFDRDTERATLYGKPGALRYKSYGVEWRSPSNAWLNHPEIWAWLFETVTTVVRGLLDGSIRLSKDKIVDGRLLVNGASIPATTSASTHHYYVSNAVDYRIGMLPALKGDLSSRGQSNKEYEEKVKRMRESKSRFRFKRISPTSSTTSWDINLDIPPSEDIPLPSYLASEAEVIHPNKGYGTDW